MLCIVHYLLNKTKRTSKENKPKIEHRVSRRVISFRSPLLALYGESSKTKKKGPAAPGSASMSCDSHSVPWCATSHGVAACTHDSLSVRTFQISIHFPGRSGVEGHLRYQAALCAHSGALGVQLGGSRNTPLAKF